MTIILKDLRDIALLNVFAAILMFVLMVWNITKNEPSYFWATLDFLIGVLNLIVLRRVLITNSKYREWREKIFNNMIKK